MDKQFDVSVVFNVEERTDAGTKPFFRCTLEYAEMDNAHLVAVEDNLLKNFLGELHDRGIEGVIAEGNAEKMVALSTPEMGARVAALSAARGD